MKPPRKRGLFNARLLERFARLYGWRLQERVPCVAADGENAGSATDISAAESCRGLPVDDRTGARGPQALLVTTGRRRFG